MWAWSVKPGDIPELVDKKTGQRIRELPWAHNPSKPPPDVKAKILSMSASIKLGARLDLEQIAKRGINLTYVPKGNGRGNTVTPLKMTVHGPAWGTAVGMIFASGTLIVTGARSLQATKLAGANLASMIIACGFPSVDYNPEGLSIVNITASVNLGFSVKTGELQKDEGWRKFISLDTEDFNRVAGVTLELEYPTVKVSIFPTGKAVITGATTEDSLDEVVDIIYPLARLYAKQ